METSLVKIQSLTPQELFKNKELIPTVELIIKEVRSIPTDPTTPKGMDEIKSLAFKVAKTKTFVDKIKKEYTEEIREFLNETNSLAKTAVEMLQSLQDEVRKPATEYEEREKKRVQDIKNKIDEVVKLRSINGLNDSLSIMSAIKKAEEFNATSGMDEFTHHAIKAKEETLDYLSGVLIAREEYEENERERIKLLKEKEERDCAEKEEEIRRQAKQKAELEASKKIEEEKLRIQKEADEKIRLAREESDRVREEEEARARNIEHRKKINNEIKDFFFENLMIPDDQVEEIVALIVSGQAPHISVKY